MRSVPRVPLRFRSLALAALLVGAIAVNVGQFRAIDSGGESNFAAVQRGETADLVQMAFWECQWCRDRYSPHVALRVVAPGSRVVVVTSSPFELPSPWTDEHDAAEEVAVRLLTFGGASHVEVVPDDGWVYDGASPYLVAGVDPAPYVIASGEGGEKGAPWVVAVDPRRLADVAQPDPNDYLEQALANDEHRRSDRPPGDFVLVRWHLPRPGSDFSYQDLLLEASLLPANVQESLW